jgi:hypothetical protein
MNQLKEFRRKNREPGSSMAFYILFSISNSLLFSFFFAGKLPYKIRELIILLSMVFIQWNGYYSNKIKDITIGKDVQTNILMAMVPSLLKMVSKKKLLCSFPTYPNSLSLNSFSESKSLDCHFNSMMMEF